MKNVVFFGTPEIAKVCLESIYNRDDVRVLAVFCQPDKQKDRHGNFVFCPVKQFCIDHNIEFLQPENINNEYEYLKSLNPDVIITCAYGQFIGEKILNLPKYKCINFHASLLPKLRGGAPIHWAIINGESKTGISLMYMVKKMDAGDVLKQYEVQIDINDTYSSLYVKLCELIKQIVSTDFSIIFDDSIIPHKQDESKVTFGYNISKEQTFIDFNNLSLLIYNLIRGLNDKPIAKIHYKNQDIKVYSSSITNIKSTQPPGTIISISKNGIQISTLDFDICLELVQLPSKKITSINQLINGNHPFIVGDKI